MAAKNEPTNSLIGEGSVFEGRFYVAGSLRVDGKFEGEVLTDDNMIIGETGKVKTNIRAARVVVSGTIIGNVHANEEVRLQETGKILGNINAPNISIQNGVIAKGEFEVTGKESGNIQKKIEEEYAGRQVVAQGGDGSRGKGKDS